MTRVDPFSLLEDGGEEGFLLVSICRGCFFSFCLPLLPSFEPWRLKERTSMFLFPVRLAGSAECQQLDWKSGHQTACTPMRLPVTPVTEERFQFYEVPYVAHWAINLQNWKIKNNSKEHLGIILAQAVLSAS